MKKLLFVFAFFMPIVANAFTGKAEVNGIWYYIVTKGQTAEVVIPNDDKRYSGDVIIPATIEYEGIICNVTSIGQRAFQSCNGLTSISIPEGVTSIGYQSFQFCDGLTNVAIPSSITSIGEGAFQYCSNLSSYNITDLAAWCNIEFGTNSVYAQHLFLNGEEVKDLVIPSTVNAISNNAFQYIYGIVTLTIPDGVKTIGKSAFYGCTGLTSVNIGNSVTSIGESAFDGCSSLTTVNIGNGVKSIGGFAFNSCSNLTTVVVGNGITSLGNSSFSKCPELSDFYCYAENVPSTYTNSFSGSYVEYATLHVPANSVDKYKAREPWKYFNSIVTIESHETKKCAIPTISYSQGKLIFGCETEGAICHSTIEDSDIRSYLSNEIQLTATYRINVYATKEGFENSDMATATLCWIDTNPTTEGIENGIAQIRANAVLIQSNRGTVNIAGVTDGTDIAIYSSAGMKVGSAKASGVSTSIATSLHGGEMFIVMIGNKVVKVVMK